MTERSHLSDDRIVEVCLDRQASHEEEAHLAHCERCGTRRSRLNHLLREVDDSADIEADAAFSEERLAAQQSRILHRIEQDGRPARVITFPASPTVERAFRTRPAGRWIAGAAAAGLAIGMLAGHLAHDLRILSPGPRMPALRAAASRSGSQPAIRAVNASVSDEEFLGEIETALEGPRLAVLRPLNELTPP